MTSQNRWVDIKDAVGIELLNRDGDLKARLLLMDIIEALYVEPGETESNDAVCLLWHAEYYLADRIGYEMSPAPVGMILNPEFEVQP